MQEQENETEHEIIFPELPKRSAISIHQIRNFEEEEDEKFRQKILNCIPVKRNSTKMNEKQININIQIEKVKFNTNKSIEMPNTYYRDYIRNEDIEHKHPKFIWLRLSNSYK